MENVKLIKGNEAAGRAVGEGEGLRRRLSESECQSEVSLNGST